MRFSNRMTHGDGYAYTTTMEDPTGTTRTGKMLRVLLALAFVVGLMPAIQTTMAYADTTDSAWSDYEAMLIAGIDETDYLSCAESYLFGAISVTCEDATDNTIELTVGETATITIYPYQHVQYMGCQMDGSSDCPTSCGDKGSCWTEYGCSCDMTPTLWTATVTTTNSNSDAVTVSEATATETLTASNSTLGEKSTATVTITAEAVGTSTVTVSVDGLYFWTPVDSQTYTVNVTDGSDEDSPYVDGTYYIDSEADLIEYANIVNGYTDEDGNEVEADPDARGVITASFSLTSGELPVLGSSSTTGFQGELEGNGYTISGITSLEGYAFVNYLMGGTISDLTLSGTLSSSSTEENYAAFVYYAQSGTISGCTNEVNISTSRRGAAGIVYMLNVGSDDTLTITGCTNAADIASSYYLATSTPTATNGVGGIVAGSTGTKGTVNITDCSNTGSISGMNTGGIVGSLYTATSGGTVNVDGCANYGTVYTNNCSGGGIVGCAGYSTGTRFNIYISNCYNVGTVAVDSEVASGVKGFGGIVGSVGAYSSANTVSISNSYNAGSVAYTGDDSLNLGAIIGLTATTSAKLVEIDNVYWLTGTASSAIANGDNYFSGEVGPIEVTAAQLHVLEYSLNDSASSTTSWLSGCTLGHPVLSWETSSASDHDFSSDTVTWTWADDASYATATLACGNCDGTSISLSVLVTTTSTVAAGCETEGSYTMTATATLPDASSTVVTSSKTVVTEATGHSWTLSGWTWASDYSAATLELVCENDSSHTVTLSGDDVTVESVTVDATCEETGSITYTATATYEDVEYTDVVVVELEALGHTWDVSDWTWADDYSSATLTLVCSECGETVDVEADVDSVTVDATCEAAGSITYTATASYEDVEYSDIAVVELEALGHTWVVSGWTWASDYSSATLTLACDVDGATVDVEAEVASVTVDATCTEAGSITYTATATYEDVEYSDIAVVELEALGHTWQVSDWTWSDDYTSATLTLVCSECDETVDVSALVEASRGASSVTYSATVSYDDTAYAAAVEVAYAATRIGGSGRYATAALEALEAYGETGADTVILATGEDFPDSLAATSLAGALDAPILLTRTATLSSEAAAAISALGASKVIVIGGEGAVSAAVVSALEASGLDVERVYGSDRYATAEAIYTYGLTAGTAGSSVWGDTVIVASGTNYADALSASSLAYAQSFPILLADKTGGLKESSEAILSIANFDTAVTVGGTSVVSAASQTYLVDVLGKGNVERLYGSNRYLTSVALANWTVEQGYLTWDGATFASGDNYPDALAGSALAGSNGSVLLLVNDARVSTIAEVLSDVADQVDSFYVLGGEGAVSASVLDTLVEALGWEGYDYTLVNTL